MRTRTIAYLAALLITLGIVAAILHLNERDDHLSVGPQPDEDQAMYDEMLRRQGFVRLNAEQLRELLDVTFYAESNEWVIYYDADGNGRFRYNRIRFSDGTHNDTGTREITADGRYCTKWKKLRDGRRRCGRVWRKGGTRDGLHYGMLRHGYIGSKYLVKQGNRENL